MLLIIVHFDMRNLGPNMDHFASRKSKYTIEYCYRICGTRACTSVFQALAHGNIQNETTQRQQRKKVRRVKRARKRSPDDLAITLAYRPSTVQVAVDEFPT